MRPSHIIFFLVTVLMLRLCMTGLLFMICTLKGLSQCYDYNPCSRQSNSKSCDSSLEIKGLGCSHIFGQLIVRIAYIVHISIFKLNFGK